MALTLIHGKPQFLEPKDLARRTYADSSTRVRPSWERVEVWPAHFEHVRRQTGHRARCDSNQRPHQIGIASPVLEFQETGALSLGRVRMLPNPWFPGRSTMLCYDFRRESNAPLRCYARSSLRHDRCYVLRV